MATWIASDIGRPDDKGVITYRGLIFFNTATNSSSSAGGKLAFLDNIEALFITQVNVSSSNRPQATTGKEIKLRHSHYSHSPSTIQFCHTSLA